MVCKCKLRHIKDCESLRKWVWGVVICALHTAHTIDIWVYATNSEDLTAANTIACVSIPRTLWCVWDAYPVEGW